MAKLEKKSKQNPKLQQSVLKDGRISLYLEYYLGRSETPELDENGNQVYYTSGAMAGKPKYKVKHVRKKENLNLYLYAHPKDQRERLQNKNTLKLAEDTRHEREKRFLEDREGYKFKKDNNVNFLEFFQNFIEDDKKSNSYNRVSTTALRKLKSFLEETQKYQAYSTYLRSEQITKEMVKEFSEYLKERGVGRGPLTLFNRFKRVMKIAYEQELIRKNPAEGITIRCDRNRLTKEILSTEEIQTLAATHYPQENNNVQRAFLLTLFTGIRFCDVSKLTFKNVDYTNRTLKFEQSKTKHNSTHNQVIIPLNDTLIDLIGYPTENQTSESPIFNLPGYVSSCRSVKYWVQKAGINKHITWHCGRHSFAVNVLSAGANIKTVSTLLGHSSISVTEQYLHVIDSQKVDAINSLGEIGYTIQYEHKDRRHCAENFSKKSITKDDEN